VYQEVDVRPLKVGSGESRSYDSIQKATHTHGKKEIPRQTQDERSVINVEQAAKVIISKILSKLNRPGNSSLHCNSSD